MKVSRSGRSPAGGLPPAVEVPGRDDVGRDARVVELEQRLLVDADVAAAGPLLERGDLLDRALVGRPEVVVRRPLPLDEGVPDEQLPGDDRVDRAVLHPPADDERQPVEGDPLGGDDRAALGVPPRLGVLPLDQVLGELLDRLRVDPRDGAGEQPAGLDQLGGHHPARRLLRQRGARRDHEAGVAGAEVLAARPALVALRLLGLHARRGTAARRAARRGCRARRARRPARRPSSRAGGRCRAAGRAGPATPGCAGSAGTPASPCAGTGCRDSASCCSPR